jgi:hypothetical protein
VRNFTIPAAASGVPASVLAVGEMSDSTFLVSSASRSRRPPPRCPPTTRSARSRASPPSATRRTPTGAGHHPRRAAGTRTLVVNGVADLDGNVTFGATRSFNYVDVTIPAGYYNAATGSSARRCAWRCTT